jgi:hypothetical protein
MPKVTTETKNQIKQLSTKDLQEIVVKIAGKSQFFYDFIAVKYLDKENGERDFFEKTKKEITDFFYGRFKGYSRQQRMICMLKECNKKVNEFCKISSNKELEAELLIYILDEVFIDNEQNFGTYYISFDKKVAALLKRLINVVTQKMHEDLQFEYKPKINQYLDQLHRTSNFLSVVYELPAQI